MDREFSEELTGLMPVVRHRVGGVNCQGCIVAAVEDGSVELQCNACGSVVGVVQVGIMEGLLGLDCITAVCPYCGGENASVDLAEATEYTCEHCGELVELGPE